MHFVIVSIEDASQHPFQKSLIQSHFVLAIGISNEIRSDRFTHTFRTV